MREDSLLPPDWPGGWPPSNYPIFLAVLLLLATALALVVGTEETGNEVATVAYFALVVGVVLRVAEHLAGDRLRPAVAVSLARLEARLLKPARPAAMDPTRGRRRAGRRPRGGAPEAAIAHAVARYTAVATGVGGLAVVLYWWRQPATVVPTRFLLGWVVVVWLLASVAVATRRRR